MLSVFGYTHIEIVENGKIATDKTIERIIQNPNSFHCILMDLQMPIMNGIESTNNIRNNNSIPASSQPYIIGLTTKATLEEREQVLKSGMNYYLSKRGLVPSRLVSVLESAYKYFSNEYFI